MNSTLFEQNEKKNIKKQKENSKITAAMNKRKKINNEKSLITYPTFERIHYVAKHNKIWRGKKTERDRAGEWKNRC